MVAPFLPSHFRFSSCLNFSGWQEAFRGMEIAEGQSAAQDLAILAACHDVIFGVGTFAWWGAFIATRAGQDQTDGKVGDCCILSSKVH